MIQQPRNTICTAMIVSLLTGCSDSPECGSADSIDTILGIVAEQKLVPIDHDPNLSETISGLTFEKTEDIVSERAAALTKELEAIGKNPVLSAQYVTDAEFRCVDYLNEKYERSVLKPLSDELEKLNQDLAVLAATAPDPFDEQGVASEFEKKSPPPPLEPYEWSQWDSHLTAKAEYVDKYAREWQERMNAHERASSTKNQERDEKQRYLDLLANALENEVPALCSHDPSVGQRYSSNLPVEIFQEIESYIEDDVTPRINERNMLVMQRNALEEKIENIRLDALRETTDELMAKLENPHYELQKILTRSVNKDTGAVTCKAEILTEFRDFDPILSQIEYTIEKTSEGDTYGTVTAIF